MAIRMRGGQPRLGQQACGDDPLRNQENLAVARDYDENSSDDDDFPPLNKLLPKQRGDLAAAKPSPRSMTENTVDYTLDRKPVSLFEPRAGSSQDEPIMLNDDDDESKSAQSEGTHSEAGDGYHDVGTTGELDAAPREPTCRFMGSGFDPASQLLLSDGTDGVANSSHANDNNNGVIDDMCPPLTKRQRSTSSCGDPTPDCDGPDELEDDSVSDIIATDDDEDARPPKRRRLPAISYRYPSPASTISKIQEDETDQTKSPIAAVAAIQQPDLRSGHNCHRESIAEIDGDSSLRPPISNEPANTNSSVTVAHQSTDQSTDVGDSQPDDSWEIRNIIGKRTIDGVAHYWVDWDPTWMCGSELKGARELIEDFEARLQERRGNKKRQGKTGAAGEAQPKRRRGRPRKRV